MTSYTKDNLLTIIPARGGSKRIPGKNIKTLHHKPLIAWTIDTALACPALESIHVSTDSEEIAKIARKHGAEVPRLRSAETATDTAPTADAIRETLQAVEDTTSRKIEWILLLQPTSPFRSASTIEQSIKLFHEHGGQTVVSVRRQLHPVEWLVHIDQQGSLVPASIPNKQSSLYAYNGAIYLFSRSTLDNTGDLYSDRIIPLVMESEVENLDIDTPAEWELAEAIARGLHTREDS